MQTHKQILAVLPHWIIVERKLHRTFVFKDFVQAFDFMSQVALLAEKMNHHPEWSNVYQRVVVNLITHSADQITELDIELATQIDVVFNDMKGE